MRRLGDGTADPALRSGQSRKRNHPAEFSALRWALPDVDPARFQSCAHPVERLESLSRSQLGAGPTLEKGRNVLLRLSGSLRQVAIQRSRKTSCYSLKR